MWNRCILAALLISPGCASVETTNAADVRLILQITVDQLCGDLPGRVLDRLEPGGFRYLYERGIHYANAHYRHANTDILPPDKSLPHSFQSTASPSC